MGVTVITFVLSRLSGNPLTLYISTDTPTSLYPIIEKQYHLNDPLYIQYFYYLSGLLHGDMGISKATGLPVTQSIGIFLPWTLEIVIAAIILFLAIGVPLGMIAGLRQGGKIDAIVRGLSSFGVAFPALIFGLILIFLFFFYPTINHFPALPSSGGISPDVAAACPLHTITGLPLLDSLLTGNFCYFSDNLAHLIMPAVTLALYPTGYVMKTVRARTISVLSEDYIFYLRSAGVSERRIVFTHLLKSNTVFLLTIVGLIGSTLLGATVVIETIFTWPGLGAWAVKSIITLDVSGVLGFTLVVGSAFIVSNLLVDIGYALIDPRIEFGAR
ncbi:MAG: ABC transporter permease [Nitrososphaerota archaeon]|nr:ABC transporter permease [Nitrososphaerota archaeon]